MVDTSEMKLLENFIDGYNRISRQRNKTRKYHGVFKFLHVSQEAGVVITPCKVSQLSIAVMKLASVVDSSTAPLRSRRSTEV